MVSNRMQRIVLMLLVCAPIVSCVVFPTPTAYAQTISAPTTGQQFTDTAIISVQGSTRDADDAYVVYIEHWDTSLSSWVVMQTGAGISESNKSFSIALSPPTPSNKWLTGTTRVRLTCTGGFTTRDIIIQ